MIWSTEIEVSRREVPRKDIMGAKCCMLGIVLSMLTTATHAFSHHSQARPLHNSKIRAAFLILVSDQALSADQRHVKTPELTLSLHLLQRNYLDLHPYPVYLFHSPNIEDGWDGWRSEIIPEGMNVTWFPLPDFEKLPDSRHFPSHPIFGPPGGYNHMIRFWWKGVFHVPAVQELEYYCRIDTDSFLLEHIHLDFFDEMRNSGAKYGYRAINQEPAFAIEGLQDFVETYMGTHQDAEQQAQENGFELQPQDQRASADFPIYYNNFEIVHVPTFRHDPAIQEFIQSVDLTWNIYLRRWGDAPLRTVLCKLHLSVQQTRQFCFKYWHQGMFMSPC